MRLCSPALDLRVLRRYADPGMATDVSLASVAAYGESKAPFLPSSYPWARDGSGQRFGLDAIFDWQPIEAASGNCELSQLAIVARSVSKSRPCDSPSPYILAAAFPTFEAAQDGRYPRNPRYVRRSW